MLWNGLRLLEGPPGPKLYGGLAMENIRGRSVRWGKIL